MAYKLDGNTIKTPNDFQQIPVEVASSNVTINGVTKKQIRKRKFEYRLGYDFISRSEAATIINIYDKEDDVSFQVDETNKSVGPVQVHVEFAGPRSYTKGKDYNERFEIRLVEVG